MPGKRLGYQQVASFHIVCAVICFVVIAPVKGSLHPCALCIASWGDTLH